MVGNGKIEQLAYHGFGLLNSGVAKFHYLSAINTNKVVVLFVAVCFFVECYVFSKLVFGYQIGGNQQFQCIINRGAAYVKLVVSHVYIQGFGVKMVVAGVDFFQYGIPFGGFALLVFFKEGGKNAFNFLYNFLSICVH